MNARLECLGKRVVDLERSKPEWNESWVACPHCGESVTSLVTVEYDAMVDGPGCVESQEMCAVCAEGVGGVSP